RLSAVRVHFIADTEVFHTGAYFANGARGIPAENQGKPMGKKIFEVAFADLPIHRVHRRVLQVDLHFTGCWSWGGNVRHFEHVRPAESFNHYRFHDTPRYWNSPST